MRLSREEGRQGNLVKGSQQVTEDTLVKFQVAHSVVGLFKAHWKSVLGLANTGRPESVMVIRLLALESGDITSGSSFSDLLAM